LLDQNLKAGDMKKISDGIELDDGKVQVDQIAYVQGGEGKREIGLELHSGKNRVVRRLFESLDYKVVKLDRVSFAGLTKKDLPRGKWRLLNPKEIGFLKMI
jgi:23S rRNA pseudouridine2605 synthase